MCFIFEIVNAPINFLLLSNDADKGNSPVSQDDLIRTKLQNTGTYCLIEGPCACS